MWDVFEHRRVARQLKDAPKEVLKRYEKWKDIVGFSGPSGLRKIKEFHDESLRGEWKKYRSSRLGLQYRVIYKTLKDRAMIQVVNLSPHDCRKK